MKTSKISIIVCATLTAFAACKKSSDTESKTPTPNPPAPASVVCNGNGTSSFFPLHSGNKWSYSSDFTSSQPALSVTGTKTFNSLLYTEITDANWVLYTDPVYFREDPGSHNIYLYDDVNTHMEYLEIPNAPVLNQTWAAAYGYTRKVTNLNASINTGTCSYSGLLEISDHNATNTVFHKLYYKRGLYLVEEIDSSSFSLPGHYKLTSVTLN